VAYALTWRGRHDLARALPAGVTSATARMPARVVRELWARGASWPRAEHWTGPVDVVHALNYVAPPAKVPVIVMVHDLTFVRFPELCTPDTLRYAGLVRRALLDGAVIHTPSEFVAAEVRDEFGVEADRVVAIHSGLPPVTGGSADAGAALAGGSRYVLALGTVEPRKNLPGLVRAFSAIATEDLDVRLVVAGPDGWDQEQFAAAVAQSPSRDRIVRLGYVSSGARRDLLAGATVFAYPSRYEGFGLPPLEAMAVGVPVVAGGAGALPEVLGDAALLVDPSDDDELARSLTRLLSDQSARDDLVTRGRARAARYTWKATAARVTELYRSLA
jgi:glycosyltransferase involved in cell wall biosynthesis